MALQPGTKLKDKYQIVKLIGRGGFGFVYEARDTLLNEAVAIKEMIPALINDAKLTRRFILEAQATMHLRHHNIVGTRDVFQESENYYIVMECMSGGSLHDRVAPRRPMDVNTALQILCQVCAGLGYAHKRGVVHCDLKPANILFTAQGEAKVADFGIAHISTEVVSRSWHTGAHFTAGTLLYMSPEQVDGVRDDPRVDVYALGAILYQMLTGQLYLPFILPIRSITDQMRNIELIQNKPPLPPRHVNSQVPAWLNDVVMRALHKNRAQRYATANELRVALGEVAASVVKGQPRGTLKLVTSSGLAQELSEGLTSIGRSSHNQIQVSPEKVSRHHAQIYRQGENVQITDLGSSNGTFVNNRRVAPHQAVPLQVGDVIDLGGAITFTLQWSAAPQPIRRTTPPSQVYAGATMLGMPPVARPSPRPISEPRQRRKPAHSNITQPLLSATVAIVTVTAIALVLAWFLTRGSDKKKSPTAAPSQTAVAVVVYTPVVIPSATAKASVPSSTPARKIEGPSPTLPTRATALPTGTSPPTVRTTGRRANSNEMIWQKDGSVMAFVSAGEFMMGSDEYSHTSPTHTVYIDSFWIDKYEVTHAAYRRCVEAGVCPLPSNTKHYNNGDYANNPVVYVTWHNAETYCRWLGKRLPTEAEWEKACRGTDGREKPWGDAPWARRYKWWSSAPVGSFPNASPYGAFDMVGNVWEFVSDWYDAGYYAHSPRNNPRGPDSGNHKVLRGGDFGWSGDWRQKTCYYRHRDVTTNSDHNVGFRCAWEGSQ